ncbi:MAG TPA: heat-inducible transcriptional repressor HrcA, partial [Ilumatobacteraceae bacterium]|nr:heat-inducible transcriptional repressor HrcA [Ilumatobacteraceae bacterium]
MLDDRKTAILRAVVQEYIATAQPVGSSHVIGAPGVQVSSATVRNDMAALEHDGYLVQPHTSAGRIPTDKGYRFFVDHLTPSGRLDEAAAQQVGDFFNRAHGRLEQLLASTSDLLARLTHHTAVVVGASPPAAAVVRSVQIVALSPRHATVVAVLSNGHVHNHTIELDDDTTDARVAAATAALAQAAVGSALGSIITPVTGDDVVDALSAQALAVLVPDDDRSPVFVGGAASVAKSFAAVDVVRSVLATLEQEYVVVSLVRDVLDRGLSVAIGAEHGLEPLSSCSVIVKSVAV